MRIFSSVLTLLGVLALAGNASAFTPLIPGNPAVAIGTDGFSGIMKASFGGETWFNSGVGNDIVSTTLNGMVVKDGSTGYLDFLYQIETNANSHNVEHLTFTNFGGTVVDIGYATQIFGPGSQNFGVTTVTNAPANPDTASLTADGSTVDININPGTAPTGISPGQISYIYVIRTTADTFTNGIASAINSETLQFNAYGVVPEPTSMVLAGIGIAGLAGAAFRRRRQTVA